jgi:methylenetetrahydrofolate reductase (NADPH)
LKFSEIYGCKSTIISLEFFPPKSPEQLQTTYSLIQELSLFNPDYMTVTYGAGGGTRILTRELVGFIHNNLHVQAVSHLTCIGHSKDEIDQILDKLKQDGISNIMALRGDAPRGGTFTKHPDGFSCARDLVKHIAKRGDFSIAVAGYPEGHQEAKSIEDDILYLKEKVDAGAEVVVTQLFFKASMYFDFIERTNAAGINVAIVPGIMPIGNISQLNRFTTMCGASIPKALAQSLKKFENDAVALTKFGIDYAIELCRELLSGGAPGIHLYTLNKSTQIKPILRELIGKTRLKKEAS